MYSLAWLLVNMEKKQTAVEWLAEQIKFINKEMYAELQEVIEQAKQMEKEQMIKFAMHLHDVDISKTGTDILMEEAEQYYNETYKQQDSGK
jgi:hypothetical protein